MAAAAAMRASVVVQRAVQFGVNEYLVMPFTVAILKEKIEAVSGTLP